MKNLILAIMALLGVMLILAPFACFFFILMKEAYYHGETRTPFYMGMAFVVGLILVSIVKCFEP